MRHNLSSPPLRKVNVLGLGKFPPGAWGPAFPLSSPPCPTECRSENSYAEQMPSEGTGMGAPQGKDKKPWGYQMAAFGFWLLPIPFSNHLVGTQCLPVGRR